jgi:hypothetical protein
MVAVQRRRLVTIVTSSAKGAGLHLSHHLAAVRLDRDLRDAKDPKKGRLSVGMRNLRYFVVYRLPMRCDIRRDGFSAARDFEIEVITPSVMLQRMRE